MKDSFILKLSANVFIIFMVMFFATLVPEYLRELFGDWLCNGRTKPYDSYDVRECLASNLDRHNPTWHWGVRHFVWAWMCVCLGIIQLYRIINYIYRHFNSK